MTHRTRAGEATRPCGVPCTGRAERHGPLNTPVGVGHARPTAVVQTMLRGLGRSGQLLSDSDVHLVALPDLPGNVEPGDDLPEEVVVGRQGEG